MENLQEDPGAGCFNLDYWQDAVHVICAADQAVLAKLGQERSWFGARQVRFLPVVNPENAVGYFPLLETRKEFHRKTSTTS